MARRRSLLADPASSGGLSTRATINDWASTLDQDDRYARWGSYFGSLANEMHGQAGPSEYCGIPIGWWCLFVEPEPNATFSNLNENQTTTQRYPTRLSDTNPIKWQTWWNIFADEEDGGQNSRPHHRYYLEMMAYYYGLERQYAPPTPTPTPTPNPSPTP